MCVAICNPPIRNPAIRNPANHHRFACIRPEMPFHAPIWHNVPGQRCVQQGVTGGAGPADRKGAPSAALVHGSEELRHTIGR
eukprot:14678960-Alexandrium_andersonii.AAC.1